MQPRHQFEEIIADPARLRDIIPPPSRFVANKVIDHLDGMCQNFIAASPFMVMATCNARGDVDLTPKGDPPGFVHVLDSKTLAVPDRLGNNRADSLCNLLEDNRTGLIFMVPGKRETLRLSGRAAMVRDTELNQSLAHQERPPKLAVIVSVERAFFHCSKCMIRSGLWDPQRWPDSESLPSLAETMVRHGRLNESVGEVDGIVERDAKSRLY